MTRRIVVLIVSVLAVGCARRVESGSGTTSAVPQAALDSVSGRALVVGADPATMVALQPASGSMVTLGGAEPLRNVAGADVTAYGRRGSGTFEVEWFVVRRVNGRAVDDGVVTLTADKVRLRMRDGTERDVPYAPPSLRALAGARVWVTRPEAGVSPSYGVIQAAR